MEMQKKKYERPVVVKQQSGLMNKIAHRQTASAMAQIDGADIDRLIREHGSPLFVMSEKSLRRNQRRANRAFKTRYPRIQFAWSYKTNYLGAVCKVFHQEGSWAEVVSEFEYDKARNLGVPGDHIIFNGPEKSKGALAKAVRDRASIHVDHFDELYDLIEVCDELKLTANVAIRVNMDVGIYPLWDRFGFNYENGEAWLALTRIVSSPRLKLVGLHTHIGTYVMSVEPYRAAVGKLCELARSLREQHRLFVEYIDIGGGFASQNTLQGQYLPAEGVVPTIEEFAEAVTSLLLTQFPSPSEQPMLILETGRALVDDAGWLISTVIANKRLSTGRRALIIDAGVNLLFTGFWYKHKITPVADPGESTEDSTIFGPLCMNIDVVRDAINLPPLHKGDVIAIHHVGAYDMTQWMQFISMRPNVVMVMENGDVELIRKAENLDYLLDREQIPEQLVKGEVAR